MVIIDFYTRKKQEFIQTNKLNLSDLLEAALEEHFLWKTGELMDEELTAIYELDTYIKLLKREND